MGSHPSNERQTMAVGCLLGVGSALLTCVLLFINGSLVMALLTALSGSGPQWTKNPEFSQFMLFLLPVILVVIQWKSLDYVRSRLGQRHHDQSQ